MGISPVLIGDGDIAAALNAEIPSEIDMLMGIAAPEGDYSNGSERSRCSI